MERRRPEGEEEKAIEEMTKATITEDFPQINFGQQTTHLGRSENTEQGND